MAVNQEYYSDVEAILSHRHDNGADYWATPDQRLMKGAPFSTIDCCLYLLELGMDADDPILKAAADLFWNVWRENTGCFRVYPKGSSYPCQTAPVATLLCRMGYAEDERMKKTLAHLLETQYQDGGWRCNKFPFGKGPETEYSNPLPTLNVLDAFRHTEHLNREPALDRAVEFLLWHWTVKQPVGPCRYGIGTLFMQVEYPFRNYNLFSYVYILSHYDRAKKDPRFLEAFQALESKLADGMVVVERVVPKLAGLKFCRKGQPSELATMRYRKILDNLA